MQHRGVNDMNGRLGAGVAGVSAVAMIFVIGALPGSDEAPAKPKPVYLEEVSGSDLLKLTLTESAAERLDIQLAEVSTAPDGGLVVPSAALIITPDGSHWVYTNPEPLVFLRHEITQVVEADFQAYFADGPPAGTQVVVTGVPELYGAEFGIGK